MILTVSSTLKWVEENIVWGVPLIVLILLVGIVLTIKLRFVQFRHLGESLKYMIHNDEGGKGEVSSFGALCISMAATLGTGKIIGVATAIYWGGPGALFWMILAAIFGMATKYAEGFLAIKYRKIEKDGTVIGGPFTYIEEGMGHKWKWLAVMFAIFGCLAGALGIGTMTQMNSITDSVRSVIDASVAPEKIAMVTIFGVKMPIIVLIVAIVVTIISAVAVIGGITRISKVSVVLVPFMAVGYFLVCLAVVVFNIKSVPGAFVTIFKGAFNPKAVTGGAVGSMIVAMQKGVARGIFSNEAGLGSAPIAAAAAQTKEPVRQGLVSMTGTFIDTIIICTMTGLSIVLTGAWEVDGLEGVAVTTYAFNNGLPIPHIISSFLLMLCLVFFAFTTILGWDYYSERCLEYLAGKKHKSIMVYRWLYILAVFIGPYMTVKAVWTIADIFNGLMAIPNMIAIFALSGVVAKETRDFFKRHKSGEYQE